MRDYFKSDLKDDEIGSINSLGLAYLGDAVFELLIRSWLTGNKKVTVSGMHKAAIGYVSAHAQAGFAEILVPLLSDEELTIYKRGRNTKVNTIPKNADISEYHAATGIEALFGYLYLKNNVERINELFDIIINYK